MVSNAIYISWDIAGAEFVVVGYEANDALIKETHLRRGDHHSETARLMFGLPLEVIRQEAADLKHTTDPIEIARYRAERGITTVPTTGMTARQCGKKCNFGLMFRMKERTFAQTAEISVKEATVLRASYFEDAHPEIDAWHQQLKEKICRDGMLTNCFGRQMPFHWTHDSYGNFMESVWNQGCAALPQSTVYDCTRVGMFKAYNSDNEYFRKFRLAGQVHDEVYGVFPSRDPYGITYVAHTMAWDYMRPQLYSTSTGDPYQLFISAKIGTTRGHAIEFDPHEDIDVCFEHVSIILSKL